MSGLIKKKTKAYQKDTLKGGNKMNKDLNGKWKCLLVLKDFTHKSMYLFDTREEAIEHGYEAVKKFNENVKMGNTSDEPIMMFYVGQIIRPDIPFDVENFIAQVQDSAYEDACECAEGYLDDVTEEHKKELEKLILGWFTEHSYLPTWHRLHNIEIIII